MGNRKKAKASYLAAGGFESDLPPGAGAKWYWEAADQLWRETVASLEAVKAEYWRYLTEINNALPPGGAELHTTVIRRIVADRDRYRREAEAVRAQLTAAREQAVELREHRHSAEVALDEARANTARLTDENERLQDELEKQADETHRLEQNAVWDAEENGSQ